MTAHMKPTTPALAPPDDVGVGEAVTVTVGEGTGTRHMLVQAAGDKRVLLMRDKKV